MTIRVLWITFQSLLVLATILMTFLEAILTCGLWLVVGALTSPAFGVTGPNGIPWSSDDSTGPGAAGIRTAAQYSNRSDRPRSVPGILVGVLAEHARGDRAEVHSVDLIAAVVRSPQIGRGLRDSTPTHAFVDAPTANLSSLLDSQVCGLYQTTSRHARTLVLRQATFAHPTAANSWRDRPASRRMGSLADPSSGALEGHCDDRNRSFGLFPSPAALVRA
jgi:hypothetical protein